MPPKRPRLPLVDEAPQPTDASSQQQKIARTAGTCGPNVASSLAAGGRSETVGELALWSVAQSPTQVAATSVVVVGGADGAQLAGLAGRNAIEHSALAANSPSVLLSLMCGASLAHATALRRLAFAALFHDRLAPPNSPNIVDVLVSAALLLDSLRLGRAMVTAAVAQPLAAQGYIALPPQDRGFVINLLPPAIQSAVEAAMYVAGWSLVGRGGGKNLDVA